MKKSFNFGKIDYNRTGRKSNTVTVDISYEERNGKKVFTASGSIWNSRHTDIIAGGQCLDTIYKYINHPTFKEIYRLWYKYHLNDMHPECIHQSELGWTIEASKPVSLYTFILTNDTYTQRQRIKNTVILSAKDGKPITLTDAERLILSLDISHRTHLSNLPDNIAPYYELKETEIKRLGWLTEKDHPDGILSKPCPVCGYKYGSSWLYFPIPDEDEKAIYKLFDTEV